MLPVIFARKSAPVQKRTLIKNEHPLSPQVDRRVTERYPSLATSCRKLLAHGPGSGQVIDPASCVRNAHNYGHLRPGLRYIPACEIHAETPIPHKAATVVSTVY